MTWLDMLCNTKSKSEQVIISPKVLFDTKIDNFDIRVSILMGQTR